MKDLDTKKSTITRLRKVEGQIKGIQKMVDEDKYCGDILIQIAAAKSALNKVGGLILENYMKNCIKRDIIDNDNSEEAIQDLINIMVKYTK
ncbi:metal-sensitive transcriptional regulator [Clostridium sp. D2Q-11]|uniref:Metal-sensitive transcriptional regulator n=1 Tax=Anaeromonas frigoriresistens TaxID=2683708 RepID=A0A942UW58_9FIRM|nr:metal-sensitive transcriptional regulator [Anaeromonas frigoriresistens]MBS4539698.1 metal-sensitive transcriptional regulator [Anaeromonas frigoriresistens]